MAKSALVSKRMAASKAQGMSGRQAAAERRAKLDMKSFKFTGVPRPPAQRLGTSIPIVRAKAPAMPKAKTMPAKTATVKALPSKTGAPKNYTAATAPKGFAKPKVAGKRTATGAGYTPAPKRKVYGPGMQLKGYSY
jgi:hypothetical protein